MDYRALPTKGPAGGGDCIQQLLAAIGPIDAVHVHAALALSGLLQRLVRNGHREGEGIELGRSFNKDVERVAGAHT